MRYNACPRGCARTYARRTVPALSAHGIACASPSHTTANTCLMRPSQRVRNQLGTNVSCKHAAATEPRTQHHRARPVSRCGAHGCARQSRMIVSMRPTHPRLRRCSQWGKRARCRAVSQPARGKCNHRAQRGEAQRVRGTVNRVYRTTDCTRPSYPTRSHCSAVGTAQWRKCVPRATAGKPCWNRRVKQGA